QGRPPAPPGRPPGTVAEADGRLRCIRAAGEIGWPAPRRQSRAGGARPSSRPDRSSARSSRLQPNSLARELRNQIIARCARFLPMGHSMSTKPRSLRVAVLSCGDLGDAVARELGRVPGVGRVALVTAPYVRKPLSLVGKMRHVYRAQGPTGLLAVLAAKLRGTHAPPPHDTNGGVASGVERHHFSDFHDPDCLATLRAFAPDLGVVAGTYILKETVFSIPRLGSINLHSGKAPEYRGARPALWALDNAEGDGGS